MQLLTYSSILAAVDPVAVLAIFQDIGVNMSLYFLVFGESLLNDGVTVVLYNTMISLSDSAVAHRSEDSMIDHTKYLLAVMSFFTVVFGGLLVGVLVGMASSFIVKFARHTRVIEPLIILVMAYFAYILAETIHWSGIISLIGCGIAQRRYAFLNLSKKSYTTVKHSVRTLCTFSDCIIFLYLGIVTFSKKNEHQWHWELITWTIVLCTLLRFVSVGIFTAVLNTTRVYRISFKEQFIIGYGGLRGAVGFSLATILKDDNPFKGVFLTATLAMVYFTVFVQGSTIKFFVQKLNIRTKTDDTNQIFDYINERTTDHIMAGVESILGGFHGHMVLETVRKFDDKYVKKVLIHRKAEHAMTLRFQEIALDEHYARLYGPSVLVHQNKVNLILKPDSLNSLELETSDDNDDSNISHERGPSPERTRKLLLGAFRESKRKGHLRKSRRMSIHPDEMSHQMNRQRERARSICLAAMTDVPEAKRPISNGVSKAPQISNDPSKSSNEMQTLKVPQQNGAVNGEQIRKAYKRAHSQRLNSNSEATKL